MSDIIEYLPWDSDFFNLKIGKIRWECSDSDKDIPIPSDWDLIYVFTDIALPNSKNICPYDLKDIKLTYTLNLKSEEKLSLHSDIKICKELTKEVLDLAFQAGWQSRFKKDENFEKGSFEKLYYEWINNSINGHLADITLIFQNDNKAIGLITLKKEEDKGIIGLIAVNPQFGNKGIGSELIQAAKLFCRKKGLKNLVVATQLDNTGACRFYEKNGFRVGKKEYIYHKWLKKNGY